MNTMRRWQWVGVSGLGLVLATLTGCQTNVAGMTLPTGRYLQHPPQYFAPSPAFPLTRELANMEAQGAAANAAAAPPAVAPPPAPVVPPAPAPGVLPPPAPAGNGGAPGQ